MHIRTLSRDAVNLLGLFLLIGFLILLSSRLAEANPIYVPDPTPPPHDIPDGGVVPSDPTDIRFVSENITVRLEKEYAFIEANYTFVNEGNTSTKATIYLPFSNLNPYINGLLIIGPNGSIPCTWSTYNLSFDGEEIYHTYNGVLFTIPLEPDVTTAIRATYHRPYVYDEFYDYSATEFGQFVSEGHSHMDQALGMTEGYYNMYVYLARTGSLWDSPIEEATFTYLVNDSICEGEFFEGWFNYDSYFHAHEPSEQYYPWVPREYYFSVLSGLAENSLFLWADPVMDGNYYRLAKTFTDWTPTEDIGITWISQPPYPIIDYEFDNSTAPGTFNFSAARSVDEDGTIVNYTWIFGHGATAYGPDLSYTFPESNDYSVILQITDDMGYINSEKLYLDIKSTRYNQEFHADDYTQSLEPGNTYTSSDHYILWRFGDGTTTIGRNVTHRYLEPGHFHIVIEFHIGTGTLYSYDQIIVMDFDPDGDGFPDSHDDFPYGPAAHKDSDGDGSPDSWNPGMDQDDSTTDLTLDAFPDDQYASMDSDGDGYPDQWNDGIIAESLDTDLQLDAYPNDPSRWKEESETDRITMVPAAAGVIIVLLGTALMMRKKSDH